MKDSNRPGAHGRTAQVSEEKGVAWKRFFEAIPEEQVLREAANLRAARSQGLPAPEVFETRINAIGMQFVEGPTMLQSMGSVHRALGLAAAMGRLHAQIHRCSGAELPLQLEEKLETKLTRAPRLPAALRDDLLRRLDRAGANPGCFCHGDFHPGNIILGSGGPVVIDWADASSGWPTADVCRTELLLRGAAGGAYGRSAGQRILIRVILGVYKNAYRRCLPLRAEDIAFWMPLVAAARLSEGIREEEDFLFSIIARDSPK